MKKAFCRFIVVGEVPSIRFHGIYLAFPSLPLGGSFVCDFCLFFVPSVYLYNVLKHQCNHSESQGQLILLSSMFPFQEIVNDCGAHELIPGLLKRLQSQAQIGKRATMCESIGSFPC